MVSCKVDRMSDNRKFGLEPAVRGWIYYILAPVLVGLVIYNNANPKPYAIALVLFMVWMGFVDPVGIDGKRRYLGVSAESVKRFGIQSIFGREPKG